MGQLHKWAEFSVGKLPPTSFDLARAPPTSFDLCRDLRGSSSSRSRGGMAPEEAPLADGLSNVALGGGGGVWAGVV